MIPDLNVLVHFYETLTPQTVSEMDRHYAPGARFKDPFNDVVGIEAIKRIFSHMFVQVDAPQFAITQRFTSDAGVMLLWAFDFRTRGVGAREICIGGATPLPFDARGRVTLHRDYWDAAEELYAKLPVLGTLMRGLQRLGRT